MRIIAIGAAAFGSVHISLLRALRDAASPDRAILMSVRLPRVLIGAAVGAILAAVGAALQALVRNPLAEGGILGISGGGAMGAIVAMVAAARLGGGEAPCRLALSLRRCSRPLRSIESRWCGAASNRSRSCWPE